MFTFCSCFPNTQTPTQESRCIPPDGKAYGLDIRQYISHASHASPTRFPLEFAYREHMLLRPMWILELGGSYMCYHKLTRQHSLNRCQPLWDQHLKGSDVMVSGLKSVRTRPRSLFLKSESPWGPLTLTSQLLLRNQCSPPAPYEDMMNIPSKKGR